MSYPKYWCDNGCGKEVQDTSHIPLSPKRVFECAHCHAMYLRIFNTRSGVEKVESSTWFKKVKDFVYKIDKKVN